MIVDKFKNKSYSELLIKDLFKTIFEDIYGYEDKEYRVEYFNKFFNEFNFDIELQKFINNNKSKYNHFIKSPYLYDDKNIYNIYELCIAKN